MVGKAGNGEDAIRLAQEIEPDLILMDLNMPGIDGLETTRRMRDADIDARIIMFTVSDEQSHVLEALRNGADGYLLKDMDAEQLIEQIRISATGRMALSPELTQVLAEAIRVRPKPTGQVPVFQPDQAREGSSAADRQGPEQQDDRAQARHHRRHREGPREEPAAQAGPAVAGGSGGLGTGERGQGLSRMRPVCATAQAATTLQRP